MIRLYGESSLCVAGSTKTKRICPAMLGRFVDFGSDLVAERRVDRAVLERIPHRALASSLRYEVVGYGFRIHGFRAGIRPNDVQHAAESLIDERKSFRIARLVRSAVPSEQIGVTQTLPIARIGARARIPSRTIELLNSARKNVVVAGVDHHDRVRNFGDRRS